MAFPIITADQRLAEKRGIKGCILGPSGIGKTSLLWTVDADKTLFFDLGAGDLAVEGWTGDAIRPRTWQECRDFAVLIGGPNPALRDEQPYSQAHYESVCAKFGDVSSIDKYDTVFIDSITVAGRLCLQWCKGQPQAFSERSGKPDTRGAYGLHGQEMIAWLTHLQHTRNKNIWFVGILDEKVDDFNRKVYSPIRRAKKCLYFPYPKKPSELSFHSYCVFRNLRAFVSPANACSKTCFRHGVSLRLNTAIILFRVAFAFSDAGSP